MDNRQQQLHQNFRQILAWSAKRPTLTGITAGGDSSPSAAWSPPDTPIARHFSALQQAVHDATARASEHEGFDRVVRGLNAEANALRRELFTNKMVHVAAIARTAIPDVARMTEALRTPRRTRKTEVLLATTEAMAQAVERYQDALVRSGLSANFPGQIRSVAAALKQVIDARKVNVVNRRGASKAFDEAIGRGRKAVDTLTALVKEQFRNDPATLAEWMQLRRIPKSGVRQHPGATAGARTGASTPVSAAPTAPVHDTRAA